MYKKRIALMLYLSSLSIITGCKPMDNKEIKTKSGLRYVVLQAPAAGAESPKVGQRIKVHYDGHLDDNGKQGKPFDSSVKRGQPFEFIVGIGQVIAGWDEALLDMKVGEKRLIILPAHLAYGTRGVGGVIPANATLRFEVELLGIASDDVRTARPQQR
jgi:FKBP-type peptidyl-prolyl cis-trans isomerase